LRKLVPLEEGDIFNVTKIRESLDAMKKLYSSFEYINFAATPITDVDDAALSPFPFFRLLAAPPAAPFPDLGIIY
jgi:outer membrane protein assembly factor BamA